MGRTRIIVLLALGATFAGFVLASNAQRLGDDDDDADVVSSVAASPQAVTLDWRETYGPAGEQIVFTVDRLEVTGTGWTAHIGIDNGTSVGWEIAPNATGEGTFGLQLFETGDPEELEERNRTNTLPSVRAATELEPPPPPILEPGAEWRGQISARGALVAGASVRVVFGTLVAVGKPPEELSERLIWITDHSYALKE